MSRMFLPDEINLHIPGYIGIDAHDTCQLLDSTIMLVKGHLQ